MAYDETVGKNNTNHLFYNAVQPAGVMQFWNNKFFHLVYASHVCSTEKCEYLMFVEIVLC
jgi:hypothetical protein